MPRLSIIIPALGPIQRLEDTLASVLANRPDDCEVIVVLNRAYDDPYELKGEVRFVQARAGAGLAVCLDAGVAAAQGPIVHVLSCGVEVAANWTAPALPHFYNPQVAAVAAVVLGRDGSGKLLSAGVRYRADGSVARITRLSGLEARQPAAANEGSEGGSEGDSPHFRGVLPQKSGQSPAGSRAVGSGTPSTLAWSGPDLLAGFYRKSALAGVGGFAAAGDAVAAIDVACRLHRAGFRWTIEPDCQVWAGREVLRQRSGPIARGYHAERLFWRWAGTLGRRRAVASHACLLAAETALCLVRPSNLARLAGRLCGALGCVLSRGGRLKAAQAPAPQATLPALAGPHFARRREAVPSPSGKGLTRVSRQM